MQSQEKVAYLHYQIPPRFPKNSGPGWNFFCLSMKYSNPALDSKALLSVLRAKQLKIENDEEALVFFKDVNYFRFADYLRPFEIGQSNLYKSSASFNKAISLYNFDEQLRTLLFSCIQKIEISLRARIVNYFSLKHGPFWFINPALANDKHRYAENLTAIEKELQRSRDDYVKEHFAKYGKEDFPPIWKIIDLTSFGCLTKLYINFSDISVKKEIAHSYNLPNHEILESWMNAINELRNKCAHHGRVWNRVMTKMPQLPTSLKSPWISEKPKINNKLYAVLCCLIYWLKAIDPKHPIVEDFKRLLVRYPMIDPFAMGFPKNWKEQCIFDE